MHDYKTYNELDYDNLVSNDRLFYRIYLMVHSELLEGIEFEDWLLWYYNLLECVMVKIACDYGVEESSTVHNLPIIFHSLANLRYPSEKSFDFIFFLKESKYKCGGEEFDGFPLVDVIWDVINLNYYRLTNSSSYALEYLYLREHSDYLIDFLEDMYEFLFISTEDD